MSVYYSAGDICLGRIIRIGVRELVVELELGITGRMEDPVDTAVQVREGEELLVRVTSADQQGRISVVLATAEERARCGWALWRARPVGHRMAVDAMGALRDHIDVFLRELTEARQDLERDRADSKKIYDTVAVSAVKQHEENKTRAGNECEQNVKNTRKRTRPLETVLEAYAAFSEHVPWTQRRAQKYALQSCQSIEAHADVVREALKDKERAYEKLRDATIAQSERECEEKLERARQERAEKDKLAELHHQSKTQMLRMLRSEGIKRGFGELLQTYGRRVMASRFNAANYECPTEIPDYIMLGTICLSIPDRSMDDKMVVQEVESQTHGYCTRNGGECVVQIPYCQRLSDGISLLVRYTPGDRNYARSLLQPLLLKQFLSFPAGRLEATMVDPLEMGASFPDIPRLAKEPGSARIIDTRVWSKEQDIENAIAALRQRLEDMTKDYGSDRKSRLRKEAVRVLAIADFPSGFTQKALRDLRAILHNSAALGVCVFICANDTELQKLGQRDGTLLTEITQSMVETRVKERRLMLTGRDRLFLQLDDMSDVLANKDQILSTISDAIKKMPPQTEWFRDMYQYDIYDSNYWFRGNSDGVAIPLGIRGADTVVEIAMGRSGASNAHHALVEGPSGAGKSNLLHTLIMSTMISYSPDEVQMYLLDFKEGVEFIEYTRYRLPSLRVVAINSEREFGLRVLKELCDELERRAQYFKSYDGVKELSDYIKKPDVPKVPRLMLIFDEVQELFRTETERDFISTECLSCVNRLVTQGRAMGIHVILACQDFRNCAGLDDYFSHMAIRIVLKGLEDGAAHALIPDDTAIHALQHEMWWAVPAIYNDKGGYPPANQRFQVSYLEAGDRKRLLEELNAYYTDPAVAPLYKKQVTRTLMINAEDDVHNCFNRLIREEDSIEPLSENPDGYGLLLGQGFGKKSVFITELCPSDGDNLLIACRDEKMAMSLFVLSAMSLLHEELRAGRDTSNALLYIVDLSSRELAEDKCDFDYLEEQFPEQVRVAKIVDTERLISSLYETVIGRLEGRMPSDERVFLLFFGIDRARRLHSSRLYDTNEGGGPSTLEMLQEILRDGPRQRINSIFWGESVQSIEDMLGDQYKELFGKRIARGLVDDEMEKLVQETAPKAIQGKSAAYIDVKTETTNTHFRPYELPTKMWVEEYADCYGQIISEEGGHLE